MVKKVSEIRLEKIKHNEIPQVKISSSKAAVDYIKQFYDSDI